MINLPHRFFAIAPEGLVRVTFTEEYVGPGTTILEGFIKNLGVLIRDFDGKGSAMSVAPNTIAIARELEDLPLHTFCRPITGPEEDSVAIVPVWAKPGSEMELEWEVPEDMGLFFIMSWEGTAHTEIRRIDPLCYLVARCEETKKTYLLPLPNLYADGRICLGKEVKISGQAALPQLDFGIKTFLETQWNTDLLGARLKLSQEMFRFNPEGEQLPPTRNWRELSTLVNHSNYAFIAKI